MKGHVQQHSVHSTPAWWMLQLPSSDRMVFAACTKESLLISGVQEHLGDFIFWRMWSLCFVLIFYSVQSFPLLYIFLYLVHMQYWVCIISQTSQFYFFSVAWLARNVKIFTIQIRDLRSFEIRFEFESAVRFDSKGIGWFEYSRSKSEVAQNWPKFCMFLAPIFWGGWRAPPPLPPPIFGVGL